MSNLEAIRNQRAETESEFQTAFKSLFGDNRPSLEQQTDALALHREICALYAAELSLITSGKLEPSPFALRATEDTSSFILPPSSLSHAVPTTEPVPPLPRQDAARLSLLPRLLARVTRRLQNRPLDDSGTSTP